MFTPTLHFSQYDELITDAATSFPGYLFFPSPGAGERKALGLSSLAPGGREDLSPWERGC